jgi:hypothetical protein
MDSVIGGKISSPGTGGSDDSVVAVSGRAEEFAAGRDFEEDLSEGCWFKVS